MDARGYFVWGLQLDHSALMEKTKLKIVEVNNTVPTCLGGNQESIHITQIDYIVEKQYAAEAAALLLPTETEEAIAKILIKEIEAGPACS